MTAQTQDKSSPPEANGNGPENTLAQAIAYEQAIVDAAEAIWTSEENNATRQGLVTRGLFLKLRPLLRRPIPEGFIQNVGVVKGKPYESTGIRSVQVQMDRLDNVLGPFNWGYKATYEENGTRCYVLAWVGHRDDPLFERDSWGGVNQGSTKGNIWKGSFTNAAKLAFARLGPGWEVYVGAADFDPDTDEDAAKAQESDSPPQLPADEKLPPEFVKMLGEKVDKAGLSQTLPVKLHGFGVDAITDLTVEQGRQLWKWAEDAEGERG